MQQIVTQYLRMSKKNSNFEGTYLEVTVKNVAYGKKASFFCTYTFFFVPLHAKLLKRKQYEHENRLEEDSAIRRGNCGIRGSGDDLLCSCVGGKSAITR